MVDVVGLRFITEGEKEAIAALSLYRAGIRQLRDLQDTQVAAMNRAMREQERATRDAIGAQRDAATAFSRLQASMDPAIAASQRYAAAQKTVREALAQGVISAQQAAAALKQLEQAYEAARLQRYAEAQRKISSEIINGNAAVNRINAAYQQMSEKVRAGTLTAQQHADAQRALARELAATNGYLTRSGALNTQKALAELRAAQATRDAAAADAAATAAKAKLTASYQQLLASVNPTIARQQQTKQVVDMLRAAVNAQAITVRQAAQALLQYRASLNALNTTAGQVSQRLNQKGVIIQQLGYQMGDFAVQVQSGTNVMVALGQQATQLIGTFAAFATSVRTVAILSAFGVLVPILTAVGAAMMRTSGSAKTLEQRVNDLTTASDRLKGTLEILTGDDMDLSAKFGDMAFAIRDTANAMRELNRASELKTLVDTVEGFGKAVAPGWLDRITDPGTLFAGMSGVAAGGGGSAAGTTRRLEESTFQKRTGFQMGLDAYESYIEGMRAAAVRGDVPELNRVFRQFIDDATDGGAAVDKITLAGGALAAEMMRVNTLVAESNARYNGTAESAKRVLNFEQERARLMERDLGAAQEIRLAQAAAQFGKESLRYRQEERAVARQSYAEQLNAQVRQNKLTVDQATDLLSIYDATQSIVDAEDRRVDAQRRLTAAYRQYAASRSAGEDSVAAKERMLAQAISDRTRETEQENRLLQVQLGFMRQGVEAAEARKMAEDDLLLQQANIVATSANATDEQRAFAVQLGETLNVARQLASAMDSASQAQNLAEQNRQQEMLLGYLQSGMTLSQAQAAVTRENAQAELDRLEALAQSVVANTELSAAARAAGQALLDAVMNARQLAPALDAATRNAGALEAAAQRIANAFAAARSAMLNLGTQELETQAALSVAKAGGDAIAQNLARAKVRARAEMKDLFGAQDAAVRAAAPGLLQQRFAALERTAAAERQLAATNAANRQGGGAGGGGANQFVSMFPELQAAYERASELASRYKQEVEILDSALARGMITQQQYNAFLQSAQAAYEQTALASEELMKRQDELAQRLGNTLGNLFMAATKGADAFRSALSNVLSNLAAMLANAAFTQLLKSSGGGFLGALGGLGRALFGSANGNVFMGGNVVPFANGGVVSGPTLFPMRGNQTGLMGEAGPEAIMPLRRGRDGKLGVAAAQTRAAPVDVRVFVDQDGNWQAKVERIADRRVRQQAPTLVRQSVQAVYATNEERRLR